MTLTDEIEEGPQSPRRTADLVGHVEAERLLLAAWSSGRLPHSWLITGPPGIGKATLAHRFARFVLVGGGGDSLFGPGMAESLYVAPEDPVFRRCASGGHSDLLTLEREMDPERERLRTVIGVDDVRRAGHFLSLTAGEGAWRVVVIDSADDLNPNAANALLKILEEPPKNSLILLVSHSPAGLLPTIRSRCSRLTLRPLGVDHVVTLLQRHLPDTPEPEIRLLAMLGEGSIGRSLRIAQTGGLDFHRALVMLVGELPKLDVPALHKLAEGMSRRDADAEWRMAMELLVWWLGRMIGAAARERAGEPALEELVEGERACIERMTALAGLEQWTRVWEKVTRLIDQTDAINLDRKQVFINIFHSMQGVAEA